MKQTDIRHIVDQHFKHEIGVTTLDTDTLAAYGYDSLDAIDFSFWVDKTFSVDTTDLDVKTIMHTPMKEMCELIEVKIQQKDKKHDAE